MATSLRELKQIREMALFRVGATLFGIDIVHIREINKDLLYTPVHDAADHIKGVLNLRGQIVTVIDLRTMFNMSTEGVEQQNTRMLIVNYQDESVGFIVDTVDDIVNVDRSMIEQSATKMEGVDPEYFSGVYKLDSDIVIILNVDKILKVNDELSATG